MAELNTADLARLLDDFHKTAESLERMTVLLSGIEESHVNLVQFVSDIHDMMLKDREPDIAVKTEEPDALCEEWINYKTGRLNCVKEAGHRPTYAHRSIDGTEWELRARG